MFIMNIGTHSQHPNISNYVSLPPAGTTSMCPQGALVYHTFYRTGSCELLRDRGADCAEGRPYELLCCTIDININQAYTK